MVTASFQNLSTTKIILFFFFWKWFYAVIDTLSFITVVFVLFHSPTLVSFWINLDTHANPAGNSPVPVVDYLHLNYLFRARHIVVHFGKRRHDYFKRTCVHRCILTRNSVRNRLNFGLFYARIRLWVQLHVSDL